MEMVVLAFTLCSPAAKSDQHIKVTLLGTGTPFPRATRFGTAILVETNGQKLLFDAGRGVVIRLAEVAVNPNQIDCLFLTHLHSDHVVGLPDLWLTGWFLGRKKPLDLLGPAGTHDLGARLPRTFAADIAARESSPENLPRRGVEIEAKDIRQGLVYDHGGVRVTAFRVDHLNIRPAVGYRVDYGGHSVVISGDTRFSENLIRFAKGADCLLHVAWLPNSENPAPPAMRSLASAEEAARVFETVQPRLAVVYHCKDERGVTEAVKAQYKRRFVVARDLMVIDISKEIIWRDAT